MATQLSVNAMKDKSYVYYSMMNSMLPLSNATVTNYSSSCYEKHQKLSGKPGTNEGPNPQDDIRTGGQAGNCAGNNCWIFKYADIKDGMLAPACIYNTDAGIGTVLNCDSSNTHPYITLSYYPESATNFFGFLSGISDYHGRTWQYN